ncbi:non-functional pseudokinase ZRK2-like [Prunus dulcis]|uniref:non-functional pseudokinase ZRK2-like n=1 Tax=Prunus dulcis TaxID=3755 RepID=UPI0014820112|nr:non-functional pseudokinase ZRK2-like [Prunus dulcis]
MPSKILQLFSMLPCFGKKGRDVDIESSYYKNLSKLLEDLIASCDGTSLPVHCYSADDLIRATNNFDPSCIVRQDSNYKMFRGFLNDWSIIVAMYADDDDVRSQAIRYIVISIHMSNHENVLKLLGCCLEFPVPALVLENAAKGVLKCDGSLRDYNEGQSLILPWKIRLRIAKQLASAVTYLHTALPSLVIHRDLKPGCIFLDHDYVPKLSNFSLSVRSGRISEKTDVYSFGVLLLIFLTGRRAWWLIIRQEGGYSSVIDYMKSHAYQLQAIVDPKILEEVGEISK